MASTRTTRTTRSRAAAPKRDTPPKPTGLNLDKLAREGAPDEPYTCILGGRLYTFEDPLELDWQIGVALDPRDAALLVQSLLSADDWERFRQVRMPGWKLVELVKDMSRYYGATPEAEGKDDGSPPSLNGTA